MLATCVLSSDGGCLLCATHNLVRVWVCKQLSTEAVATCALNGDCRCVRFVLQTAWSCVYNYVVLKYWVVMVSVFASYKPHAVTRSFPFLTYNVLLSLFYNTCTTPLASKMSLKHEKRYHHHSRHKHHRHKQQNPPQSFSYSTVKATKKTDFAMEVIKVVFNVGKCQSGNRCIHSIRRCARLTVQLACHNRQWWALTGNLITIATSPI